MLSVSCFQSLKLIRARDNRTASDLNQHKQEPCSSAATAPSFLTGWLQEKRTSPSLCNNYLLSELSSVLESSSSCTGTLMSWKSSLRSVKHSHSRHLVLSTSWPWNSFSTSSKTASSVPRESICQITYHDAFYSKDASEPGYSASRTTVWQTWPSGIPDRNWGGKKKKQAAYHMPFLQYHLLVTK